MPAILDPLARTLDLDPREDAFVQDPYPAYRAMRQCGPLVRWSQYGFWCATTHEAVNALLRDRRFGRQILHVMDRAELGWPEPPEHLRAFLDVERHSLLELEPPAHTRLRALVNRAFVSRQVERLRPRIAALANGLVDRFEGRGEVELLEAFATPIPVIVIAELLGVPAERKDDLLDWSHRMVAMYQFRRTREDEEAASRAASDFVSYLREIVAARRRAPRDDLVSHLVAVNEREDRLSEDELVTTCILLLNAGHEATVHAIGNGVKALLQAGADVDAAFADDAGALRACDELLRFDAPLHLFTRYALEDVDLHGVRLRKGETIGLLLGSANRDEGRFADPDRLDLARDASAHLSFGAGIHFCIGAPLARLEMQVALPILLRRLPGLRIAAAPRYRDTYHFHGLQRLDLAW